MTVLQDIEEIVKRLVAKYRITAVILFGSRARGDWGPWSDYDLLIIGDFKKKYVDRIGDILELLSDIKIPVEPHPYTLEESLKMLRKGNPLIIDAIECGKVLYRDTDYEELLKAFLKLKKNGMRRSNTSIILPEATGYP
ncbi:MAG: nucleotidyltransferase domain-containing protein [Thermoproteota archaeon]|nr:nucleotidyltransferase domain-containing protein [Candidatus Brockarchaeota archaeon]MBO3840692.1 nucleotidyltransferase domain-containing protein [Candidatus Brockarchaeota archaeon]